MFILTFRRGHHIMTRWDWRRLLELAELGGWRPVDSAVRTMLAEHRLLRHASALPGSEPPVPHPWCTREIPLRDARALASSLRDVLLDVPHHDSVEAKAPAVRSRAGTVRGRMIAPGDTVSPVEEFSGARRTVVGEIIDLIRDGGAFRIRYLGSDA